MSVPGMPRRRAKVVPSAPMRTTVAGDLTGDTPTSTRGLPTVREAARRRMPLDGADAQALEHALFQAETECAALRKDISALKTTYTNDFLKVAADALDDVEDPGSHPVGAPGSVKRRAQDIGKRLRALLERVRSTAEVGCVNGSAWRRHPMKCLPGDPCSFCRAADVLKRLGLSSSP